MGILINFLLWVDSWRKHVLVCRSIIGMPYAQAAIDIKHIVQCTIRTSWTTGTFAWLELINQI
jgi:hypothetical protein